MQHRQEDRHDVYVGGNRDDNNAKHRQGYGHAVYVNYEKGGELHIILFLIMKELQKHIKQKVRS